MKAAIYTVTIATAADHHSNTPPYAVAMLQLQTFAVQHDPTNCVVDRLLSNLHLCDFRNTYPRLQ